VAVRLPGAAEAGLRSADDPQWLDEFLWRFFQTSQFKRSALPNSPKVSAGGSLSPRGDWRAPSDGVAGPGGMSSKQPRLRITAV
jgi:hypothetical protein